jgi:hypothetical protein
MKTCYKQALFFLVLTKFQHLVGLNDENKRPRATYLLSVISVDLLFYVGRASAKNFRAYHSRARTSALSGVTKETGVYDVRAFGAKGDSKALDTPAINKARYRRFKKSGVEELLKRLSNKCFPPRWPRQSETDACAGF